MKAYLTLAVCLSALSVEAGEPKLLAHLAPRKPLLSFVERKAEAPPAQIMDEQIPLPPLGIIGAWQDQESGRVITANYETAKALAEASDRPLVVISKVPDCSVGKCASEAPKDAIVTVAPLAQSGVYQFNPVKTPAGKVELRQIKAPPPPAPTKAKKASFELPQETVYQGCPGGICKPRVRWIRR